MCNLEDEQLVVGVKVGFQVRSHRVYTAVGK